MKNRRLQDEYQFPGYRPKATIKGIFGDPYALLIKLKRRQKKQYAAVVVSRTGLSTTEKHEKFVIYRAEISGYTWKLKYGVFFARSAVK